MLDGRLSSPSRGEEDTSLASVARIYRYSLSNISTSFLNLFFGIRGKIIVIAVFVLCLSSGLVVVFSFIPLVAVVFLIIFPLYYLKLVWIICFP